MIRTEEVLKNNFFEIFGQNDNIQLFFAPGRVNLIGEHTDYTGGYALPFAINCGTYIVAAPNDSSQCNVFSKNFNDGITSINMIGPQKANNHWSDYLRGIIYEFSKIGITFSTGIDAYIYGNIPNGSGLSSSASLELALILALTNLNGQKIPEPGSKQMIDYCILAQKVENDFIGVNCGIMDQFIIGNAKSNFAINLNCYNLDFQYIPLSIPYQLLVLNTKKTRKLHESKYNERRLECEKGFAMLQNLGCQSKCLGQISLSEWQEYSNSIKKQDNIIWKRLTHVISENSRVLEVCNALKNSKFDKVFDCINQSGVSLKENFEVTGQHLDAIVDVAHSIKGVVASRMTGGGFGGCAIALVEPDYSEEAIAEIKQKYEKITKIEPEIYQFTHKIQQYNADSSYSISYNMAFNGATEIQ